jgi:hypothetical protein
LNEKTTLSISITVNVILDEIDSKTMEIFQRFSHKGLRVHQLRNILEYEGLPLGYGELRNRLLRLSFVGLLERERANHSDRYHLQQIICSRSSAADHQ